MKITKIKYLFLRKCFHNLLYSLLETNLDLSPCEIYTRMDKHFSRYINLNEPTFSPIFEKNVNATNDTD